MVVCSVKKRAKAGIHGKQKGQKKQTQPATTNKYFVVRTITHLHIFALAQLYRRPHYIVIFACIIHRVSVHSKRRAKAGKYVRGKAAVRGRG